MKRYTVGYEGFKARLLKIAKRLPPPLADIVIPTKRSFLRSHAEWECAQKNGTVLPGSLRIAHEGYRGKRGSYITEVGSVDCLINTDWRIWTIEAGAQFTCRSVSWVYENVKDKFDKWNGWAFSCVNTLSPHRDNLISYYPITYQCLYLNQCKEEAKRNDIKLDCTKCLGLIALPPYTG